MDDDGYDYGSMSVEGQQEFLYDVIGFHGAGDDEYAHHWFYEAFYNDDMRMDERIAMMDELSVYLWDTYGIDFEAVWDWDDFREWYGDN